MTADWHGRQVMTVTGPVHPSRLGVTLAHEHLLLDLRCLWHEPADDWKQPLVDAPVSAEARGALCTDPYISRDNLVIDDADLACAELQRYREAGGQSVVDLTVNGLHPRPLALREISTRTGVTIVAGCGWYVRRAHPAAFSDVSEEQLEHWLRRDILEGLDGSDVRPGIIGELGTSSPIHPDEARVLRAAARAQRQTGLAINVHVAIFAREALNVLDLLEDCGADLTRVVISHLDEMLDLEYHRAVLRRGAYVEYDTFGSEVSFDTHGTHEPSDHQRVDALLRLLHEGWTTQLLLSQDVCTKMQLCRFGGFGYAHVLRTIVPRLGRRGVDAATLETMLVANPARVLSIAPSIAA